MNPASSVPAGRDALLNLGIASLLAVAILSLVLRGAASIACWLTGVPHPTSGWATGLGVLVHPGRPGPMLGADLLDPFAYWTVAVVLLIGTAFAIVGIWTRTRRVRERATTDPHRIPGTATRDEIRTQASSRALLRRAATLRPSLTRPQPGEVGYLLGTSHGVGIWASVEDSMLVIGPPRSGKGLHLVINMILDAPGPVVTTSTRPDNLTATLTARSQIGPVAVFDPQHLAEGLPAGLKWSPVRGCQDPLTAMIRATGLAAATGIGGGGVDNGGFWEGKTRVALQSLLHAAALDGRDSREVFRWTLDPNSANDAVTILRGNTMAATGWADALDAMIHADPRTRDSIWQGVSLALASLADPRVLDTVTPADGDQFDPETFLRDKGTLYLLATGAGAGASAPLVAAFIEDLVETARHLAATSPGARLDPPLLLALDEVANIAPLPSLPTLMAEGGGTGITTMPVLQSLSQARAKWGADQAGAIWDAAIVKVILGGASNPADLRDMSTLIGERDDTTTSHTITEHGFTHTQTSLRRLPVMPPETIRTLPFGTAVTLLRTTRPIITDLRPWTNRTDAAVLQTHRRMLEHALQTQS